MRPQVPFKADYSIAVATPVWGDGNILFISAEYNGGAKVVRLERDGLRTRATELWSSNRLRLRDAFTISASAPLLSRISWTPPVLVGTRLYLRDRRELLCVDLG